MSSELKMWNEACQQWETIQIGDAPDCHDFIQSETSSYITVCTNDDAKENGAALIAAYDAAKLLTPNGAALATDNRACVILPPAKYNLDHVDAPAPSGITITPDAVGANPVTWYYRVTCGLADGSLRSLISDEDYFTIGDDTTEIIVDGGVIPDWAEVLTIILGTTSGYYDYMTYPGITSFPSDIFGAYMDLGMGNLYPLGLLAPVHQDCAPLTLDTEFVDIIGLTTDRSLQHIYGTPPALNSGVIVQTADDVHISNLTVEILTEVAEANFDNTDSAAYFPATNLSTTVIDNCYFNGGTGEEDNLFSMRIGVMEYSGTFTNCTGGDFSFGAGGIASGIFTNCTGGDCSFGDGGTASGIFTNCTGGDHAFGAHGEASGTFMNCTGGTDSFGRGGTASGTFNYCTGGDRAFGAHGEASGTFMNCTGGEDSFGRGGTASGTFNYCTGGTDSFGKGGTASGTFNYCTGGAASFGTNGIASGTFSFCKAGAYSFGEEV